jgi:hypothetical protein
MLTIKSKLLLLSRYYWLILLVFIAVVVSFVFYVRAEKAIDRANEARHASILLAGELRQSSDDLTRMARTYVVTGNPLYQQHYREILAIRDGNAPVPLITRAATGTWYWATIAARRVLPRLPPCCSACVMPVSHRPR